MLNVSERREGVGFREVPESLGDVQMGDHWKYYLKVSLTIMYIILDVLL